MPCISRGVHQKLSTPPGVVLNERMTSDCMIDVPEVLVEERAEEDDTVARLSCERSENVDSCVDNIIIVLVEDEKTSMVNEVGRE